MKNNEELHHSSLPTLKLLLWMACGSIAMFFVAFSSAYVVQRASSYWENVELPNGFLINCFSVLLISIFAHLASKELKSENDSKFGLLITLTLISTIAFTGIQVYSFNELINEGVHLLNEVSMSGPWLYIIAGSHALHIILGIGFIVALILCVKFSKNKELNKLRGELCATYLHFMGAIWIYLYLFLVINH